MNNYDTSYYGGSSCRSRLESRTYFLDKMQEKLNERMLRDEELERMRR